MIFIKNWLIEYDNIIQVSVFFRGRWLSKSVLIFALLKESTYVLRISDPIKYLKLLKKA